MSREADLEAREHRSRLRKAKLTALMKWGIPGGLLACVCLWFLVAFRY